ncbi:MAG: radical SAM protein [Candidatus Omnitrophica bacterium]|nr:radical SAM protein [Candidatus Omnitrophota bacterium]MDD5670329.1 radical SAM protein [Candidatus Omnitrophota bacterium]
MTNKKNCRYVYGPVASWRLGSSLGIDPISAEEKICTFDCVYCQLGRTKVFSDERHVFVSVKDVVDELKTLPVVAVDYITFSGAGEPTLAKNLGDMIQAVRKVRNEKIAVITNASLMNRKDVREDLSQADFILAKLDAGSEDLFQEINRPMKGISFDSFLQSMKEFRAIYKGRFALQMMFILANEGDAGRMAAIAKELHPDEVEINTPLRTCGVRPLCEAAVCKIESRFRALCGAQSSVINVFNGLHKKVSAISTPDTLKRRGKS